MGPSVHIRFVYELFIFFLLLFRVFSSVFIFLFKFDLGYFSLAMH